MLAEEILAKQQIMGQAFVAFGKLQQAMFHGAFELNGVIHVLLH
jgi:hypothetical protein